MTFPRDVVFPLDVDNTLSDNDRVIADLQGHLEREFGIVSAARYWVIFDGLRSDLGYADYRGAVQRYRLDAELGQDTDPRLPQMSGFLIDYPFADRLYPRALEVMELLGSFGPGPPFSHPFVARPSRRRPDARRGLQWRRRRSRHYVEPTRGSSARQDGVSAAAVEGCEKSGPGDPV